MLHEEISDSDEYEGTIVVAWTEKIRSTIATVQKSELDNLLSNINALSYAELIKLHQKAQHYSFNKDVLKSALVPLDELIDQMEQTHLAELCSGIETYSPSKLKVLEEKINALHYRDKNTKKPLAKIRGLRKDNGVLEKCSPIQIVF